MATTLRQLIAQHSLILNGEPNLGPFDDLPLPDEERAAVQTRADQWCSSLKPNNTVEMWLLEQVALQSIRLERCQVDEAVQRDTLARRAIETWDNDRALEAEKLAKTLPLTPAAVASQLRSTLAGSAWLLKHWTELQTQLETQTPWTPSQTTRALHLLGLTTQHAATLNLPVGELRALVRSEIARLQALHDGPLADLDHRARSAAARGLGPTVDAALAPLRRLETGIARRLEWLLNRFDSGRRPANLAPGYRPGPDGRLHYVDRNDQPAYIPPNVDPATVPPINEPSNEPKPKRPSRRALANPLPPLWNFRPDSQPNASPHAPAPPSPTKSVPDRQPHPSPIPTHPPSRRFPTQRLVTPPGWAMMRDRTAKFP